MDGPGEESFRHMENLFRTWLEGARHREILRLLQLVRDEPRHTRGAATC